MNAIKEFDSIVENAGMAKLIVIETVLWTIMIGVPAYLIGELLQICFLVELPLIALLFARDCISFTMLSREEKLSRLRLEVKRDFRVFSVLSISFTICAIGYYLFT